MGLGPALARHPGQEQVARGSGVPVQLSQVSQERAELEVAGQDMRVRLRALEEKVPPRPILMIRAQAMDDQSRSDAPTHAPNALTFFTCCRTDYGRLWKVDLHILRRCFLSYFSLFLGH